jgi:hypothetical protein
VPIVNRNEIIPKKIARPKGSRGKAKRTLSSLEKGAGGISNEMFRT